MKSCHDWLHFFWASIDRNVVCEKRLFREKCISKSVTLLILNSHCHVDQKEEIYQLILLSGIANHMFKILLNILFNGVLYSLYCKAIPN